MIHRDDGTYNIEFDDKDLFKEFKVPPSRIRKVRKEKRREEKRREEKRREEKRPNEREGKEGGKEIVDE